MRGIYHGTRVQELAQRFLDWRAERLPGARAFQSTYDKSVPQPTFLDHFSDQAWAEWERRYVAGYSKPCMIQTRYRRSTTFFHSWCAKSLPLPRPTFYTPQQPELFRFTEGILRPPIRDGANI
jgi:hypothetical protein